MKGSLRCLAVLAAVITMYVTIIISMYDPELMATLDGFVELMPELMAAVGMDSGANNLLEFMISYLYGFILLIFPMVFAILRGNGLVAKYVDEGSMAALIAAPVRRTTVALTQAAVLVSGTVILLGYATGGGTGQRGRHGSPARSPPLTCCGSTGRVLPAVFHRRHLPAGVLPLFRHKVQHRLRRGYPGSGLCHQHAGQCGRRRRGGQIFHLFHPV